MKDSFEDGSFGTIAELRTENAKLREQVLQLLRLEADLFRRNEQLDVQWKIYQELSELGKRFARRLGLAEIASAVAHFTLYSLNLERCVIQLHDGTRVRTLASEGYYDDQQAEAIAALSFAPADPLFDGVSRGEPQHLHPLPEKPTARDAIGETFFLDEYALLPFRDESNRAVMGYLIAGNTARKAIHHGRIVEEEPLVLALQNVVDLAVVAFRSARLDETLQKERETLEERVKQRTAELAELNERLVVELGERALAEKARSALQDEIIRAQEERLLELSTPILPITPQILVMPLLGKVDAARAEQMLTVALAGAAAERASFVILDITGVRTPDRSFAETLEKTSRGLALLGVGVVVTGIGAEIAKELVRMDTQITALTTRATLQSGFAYAMARVKG